MIDISYDVHRVLMSDNTLRSKSADIGDERRYVYQKTGDHWIVGNVRYGISKGELAYDERSVWKK